MCAALFRFDCRTTGLPGVAVLGTLLQLACHSIEVLI